LGIVNEFCEQAWQMYRSGLPRATRQKSEQRLLDSLGNALAATASEIDQVVRLSAAGWGSGSAASAWGSDWRYPAAVAAFINGSLSHALDFDDTHLPSIVHPSASIVPAALAVAEESGSSGAELLDAITLGTELAVRLGVAGYDRERNISVFFERGFHATSICGAIGAALSAALLSGLSSQQAASAAAIASSLGAGILEANRTGGTVKRVHCGWAAQAGVMAAKMAAAGLTGPPTAFEGRFGLISSHCGEGMDTSAILGGLGELWETDSIAFKPYPCNVFTHPIIDAAVALRASGVNAEDVLSIEIGGAGAALRTIAYPEKDKARPESGYHGAFSAPYTVASALVGGGGLGLSHSDFDDSRLQESLRMRLAQVTSCYVDEECDASFPASLPAVVRVRMRGGEVHEHRVRNSRGTPANPLSDADLLLKFRSNLEHAGMGDRADTLHALISTVETMSSVEPLVHALVRRAGTKPDGPEPDGLEKVKQTT